MSEDTAAARSAALIYFRGGFGSGWLGTALDGQRELRARPAVDGAASTSVSDRFSVNDPSLRVGRRLSASEPSE